jgi:uncharacterized protein
MSLNHEGSLLPASKESILFWSNSMRELAKPEKLEVHVNEADSVSALLYLASRQNRVGVTVLLGHGAGANQNSPFMKLFASGLAARGFDAMTFNFLYAEKGRGGPDPKPRLESCYRAVIDAALKHKKLKGNRLVIGGKSMGGRIASLVASSPTVADTPPAKSGSSNLAGLVFLGYPLHPPGKPDQPRSEHLKNVAAPMLFIQGSRDAFGTAEEIRDVIKKERLRATLHIIEGGDHSFKVPKNSKLSQEQVYESAMDAIAGWKHLHSK